MTTDYAHRRGSDRRFVRPSAAGTALEIYDTDDVTLLASITGVASHNQTLTGNGTTTTFTVTHNLSTLNPDVVVIDNDALNAGTNRRVVLSPTPQAITANTFQLVFAPAPATGETFTVVTTGGSGGGSGTGATNLATTTTATSVTVTSDTGADATIPAATTTVAGVLSAADKTKLDGLSGGGATNLTVTTSATTVTVNSDTGTDATVPAATTTAAGVMTAADKTKLDGLSGSGSTNLSATTTATAVTVVSDTGNDATLASASTTAAGVLTAADKTKLDNLIVPTVATKAANYTTADADFETYLRFTAGVPTLHSPAATQIGRTISIWNATGAQFTVATGAATVNGSLVVAANQVIALTCIAAGTFDAVGGGVGGGGATNLTSATTATTVNVNSDTGTDATLAAATTTAAGVMTAADRTKMTALVGVRVWATATAYAVNDVVMNGALLYRCTVAHTSSAAFATDTANWGQLNGAAPANTIDAQGRLVLNNGWGTTTTVGVNLEQKTLFGTQSYTTVVQDSAVEVFRTAWQIVAYQVIVTQAPSTGNETYSLQNLTANTTIASITLSSGQTTTGLVTLPTPYTLPAGNQMRARILTVAGSAGFVLHVWRTPVLHGLELA